MCHETRATPCKWGLSTHAREGKVKAEGPPRRGAHEFSPFLSTFYKEGTHFLSLAHKLATLSLFQLVGKASILSLAFEVAKPHPPHAY